MSAPDSGLIRQVGFKGQGLQTCCITAVIVGDPRLRAPTTTAEYGRRKQHKPGAEKPARAELTIVDDDSPAHACRNY